MCAPVSASSSPGVYVNSLGGCITGLGYFLLCKDRVDKSRSNYVAIMKYMSRGSQWLWLYCCEPFLRSIQDCYTELYTDCTMLSQPLDSPLCTRSHPTPPCPSVEWDYSAVNTIRKRRETQIEAQSIQIIIHVKFKFCFVLELKCKISPSLVLLLKYHIKMTGKILQWVSPRCLKYF